MSYPPNLLRLDPAFRVLLPEGATGATGELDYQGPYRVAAVLAGGTSDVKAIIPDAIGAPRLAKIVGLDDSADVYLLGARPGDPVPPYLTLRLYPEFPPSAGAINRGEPIILSGRPHEHPAGSGLWDLEDLGGDARPTIASRAQLESVSQVLSDYGLILPNLASATAQLQGVLTEVRTEMDAQALEWADTKLNIEQSAAALANVTDMKLRDNLAAITGPDGFYRAADTGYAYQRTAGVNTRRPNLEVDAPRTGVTRIRAGTAVSTALSAAQALNIRGNELDAATTYDSGPMTLLNSSVVAGPATGVRPTIKLLSSIASPAPLFAGANTGVSGNRAMAWRNLNIELDGKADYAVDIGDFIGGMMENVSISGARLDGIRARALMPSNPFNGYLSFNNVEVTNCGGAGFRFLGETNQCIITQGKANANDIGVYLEAGWNNRLNIDMSDNRINCIIGAENTISEGYTEKSSYLDYWILPTAKTTDIPNYRASQVLPTGVLDEGEGTRINGIMWATGGTAPNLLPNGAFRYGWRPDGLPADLPWRITGNSANITRTRTAGGVKLTSTGEFAIETLDLNALAAQFAGQWVTVGFRWCGAAGNSLSARQFQIKDGATTLKAVNFTGAAGTHAEKHRTVYFQTMWHTFQMPATVTDLLANIVVSATPGAIGDSIELGGVFFAAGRDVYPQLDSLPLNYLTSISAAPTFKGQAAIVAGAVYIATGTASTADWKRLDNVTATGIPGVSSVYRSGASGVDAYHFIGNVGATGRMMLRYQAGTFTTTAADLRDDTLELNMRNGVLISSWRAYGPGLRTQAGFVAYKQGSGTTATYDIYMVTRGSAYIHALITAYIADQATGLTTPLTPGAANTATPAGTVDLDTTAANYAPAAADVLHIGRLHIGGTQVVGARGAAIANATDAATTQTQLNALLAALRTHGLIAP